MTCQSAVQSSMHCIVSARRFCSRGCACALPDLEACASQHARCLQTFSVGACTAQALSLFQQAVSEGHFRQQRWDAPDVHKAEVNLHAMTAGVAMLSLYTWLMALKQVLFLCSHSPFFLGPMQ